MWSLLLGLGLALAPTAHGAMDDLTWSSTGCSYSHDFCAELEFCSRGSGLFGYRQASSDPCVSPGPVIRMDAGKKYLLKLTTSSNTQTNIHTHGLHISGEGNADDVSRKVGVGECLEYSWDIPADHMGGTHWYHAHVHELTNAQVSGGAYGMVIIRNDNDANAAEITDWINNDVLVLSEGNIKSGPVTLTAGEWYHFRILFVDASGSGTTASFASNSGCEAYDVAYDGVWTEQVPRLQAAGTSFKLVTGASRLDLAVKCSMAGTTSFSVGTAVSVTVQAGTPTSVTPFDGGQSWAPNVPGYLMDLRQGVTLANTRTLTIQGTAMSLGGSSASYPNALSGTYNLNDVEEWSIEKSGAHPIHMHIYHFQVISGCGDHINGQYYDTISAPNSCKVRVAFKDIGGKTMVHCHFLRHEDSGMMSYFTVSGGPAQPTTNPPAAAVDCAPTPSCTCVAAYECGSTAGNCQENPNEACTATEGQCPCATCDPSFDTCSFNTCGTAPTPEPTADLTPQPTVEPTPAQQCTPSGSECFGSCQECCSGSGFGGQSKVCN